MTWLQLLNGLTLALTAAAGFDFDGSKRVIGGFGSPLCSRYLFEPGNTPWSIAGLQSKPQLSFAVRKFYRLGKTCDETLRHAVLLVLVLSEAVLEIRFASRKPATLVRSVGHPSS